MSKKTGPLPGSTAPDFTLKDGDGNAWRLSDQRGKVVVLIFYPGDETPICTKQLCSVRDRWADYRATGAEVVGISGNTVESHKSFAGNHGLPLRLLADPGHDVAKLYNAMAIIPGRPSRASFVIAPDGKIFFRRQKPLMGLLIPATDDELIAAIKAAAGTVESHVAI